MSKINNWFFLCEDVHDDKQYYNYSLNTNLEFLDRYAGCVKAFREENIEPIVHHIQNDQQWSIYQNGDNNNTSELLGYGCGNGCGTIGGGGCD